ncbi:hypothetical protein TI39_contig118g00001, partial [Zymoseptoria brevis]
NHRIRLPPPPSPPPPIPPLLLPQPSLNQHRPQPRNLRHPRRDPHLQRPLHHPPHPPRADLHPQHLRHHPRRRRRFILLRRLPRPPRRRVDTHPPLADLLPLLAGSAHQRGVSGHAPRVHRDCLRPGERSRFGGLQVDGTAGVGGRVEFFRWL